MKNIIFYIHRTGLMSYFINPICRFLYKDYHITIFHLDKKNGFAYAPKESDLYDLYDLSDKSASDIQKLLKQKNPSAVILLGFISIYELLVLRICKDLRIKTIYLEHGIYSKQTGNLPFEKLITKFASTVSKNLFFVYRYFDFIVHSQNKKLEFYLFLRCVVKKEYWRTPFDKALFFAEYGYKQITSMFHYDEKKVDYICYPLAVTNKEYEEYKKIAALPLSEAKEATFIHQPFILDDLTKWSYEEERDWFVSLADELSKDGYKLSIQVHPRSDLAMYEKLYEGTGIKLMQGIKKADYKKYSLVLGHYSTALLYPIFFGIPIKLVDYPNVCRAEESTFYPVSCELPITDSKAVIAKYDAFSKEYMGTGNLSFENIAEVIDRNI